MESPRKQQSIFFQGYHAGVVTKTEGNITLYLKPDGNHDQFIWRFEHNECGENIENFNTLHSWQ